MSCSPFMTAVRVTRNSIWNPSVEIVRNSLDLEPGVRSPGNELLGALAMQAKASYARAALSKPCASWRDSKGSSNPAHTQWACASVVTRQTAKFAGPVEHLVNGHCICIFAITSDDCLMALPCVGSEFLTFGEYVSGGHHSGCIYQPG